MSIDDVISMGLCSLIRRSATILQDHIQSAIQSAAWIATSSIFGKVEMTGTVRCVFADGLVHSASGEGETTHNHDLTPSIVSISIG